MPAAIAAQRFNLRVQTGGLRPISARRYAAGKSYADPPFGSRSV